MAATSSDPKGPCFVVRQDPTGKWRWMYYDVDSSGCSRARPISDEPNILLSQSTPVCLMGADPGQSLAIARRPGNPVLPVRKQPEFEDTR